MNGGASRAGGYERLARLMFSRMNRLTLHLIAGDTLAI